MPCVHDFKHLRESALNKSDTFFCSKCLLVRNVYPFDQMIEEEVCPAGYKGPIGTYDPLGVQNVGPRPGYSMPGMPVVEKNDSLDDEYDNEGDNQHCGLNRVNIDQSGPIDVSFLTCALVNLVKKRFVMTPNRRSELENEFYDKIEAVVVEFLR